MNNSLAAFALAIPLCFAVFCVPAAETIGDWTVTAPDSARLIVNVDIGFGWGWLNVSNDRVSINDAFSGEGILDDGYANAAIGQVVEVTFLSPVVNGPGADFVMFDAHFDRGRYSIASDFDGFGASLLLRASEFIGTGERREYFYEFSVGGKVTATIWGAEFDLSELGVPLGESVSSIRFTADNANTDPVGIGAIVPAPASISLLGVGGLIFANRRR